jgi:excisionase family DNA binding protein
MKIEIPTADIIRGIVQQELAPIREAIERLRTQRDPPCSIREAASRLGVSARTIKRAIADGSIPSVQLRGRRLVQLSSMLGGAQEDVDRIARKARNKP